MTDKQIIGAWKLVSWEISNSNNDRITRPFGDAPLGSIMYTEDGWMSATIARKERDKFPQGRSIKSLPKEIRADAFNTYFSYAGRYRVEADCVVHSVELSLNPNFVGTEQVRYVEFDQDKLILSAEEKLNNTIRRHRIVWRRPRP